MRPSAVTAVLALIVLTGCLSTGGASPVTVSPAPVPDDAAESTDTVDEPSDRERLRKESYLPEEPSDRERERKERYRPETDS